MTKSKKEVVLTGPPLHPGGVRPRFRVMKSVGGSDGSTYLVPLPGTMPAGLHISQHASGDVHWRVKDVGAFAKGNLSRFSQATDDGTLDRVLCSLMVRPKRQHSVQSLIIPWTWMKGLVETRGDLNLELDRLVASLQPVALGDSRHLAQSFQLLRDRGVLQALDVALVSDLRREGTLYFFNLTQGIPIRIPTITLDRKLPFWRSASVAISQFTEFGGVFVLFPEGRRFRHIAERVGLGWIADGFAWLDKELESGGWNPELEARVREVEAGFVPSLTKLTPRHLIRVATLRRKTDTRARRPEAARTTQQALAVVIEGHAGSEKRTG